MITEYYQYLPACLPIYNGRSDQISFVVKYRIFLFLTLINQYLFVNFLFYFVLFFLSDILLLYIKVIRKHMCTLVFKFKISLFFLSNSFTFNINILIKLVIFDLYRRRSSLFSFLDFPFFFSFIGFLFLGDKNFFSHPLILVCNPHHHHHHRY